MLDLNQKIADMLLINIPWHDLESPYVAPALLKGIAEAQGFHIITKDYNVDFKKKFCNNDDDLYTENQDYFISPVHGEHKLGKLVKDFYQYMVDDIAKQQFKYLGISVFSQYTQKSALEICQKVREKYPEIKIVLGGRGLNIKPGMSINNIVTPEERFMPFSVIMKKRKLCDHMIIGDAEDALIKLFRDVQTHDDSKWYEAESAQLDYPFSNFDDYELDAYRGVLGRKHLHVISSKGCVRKCDFCDVGFQFQKKFKSKDGKRWAAEMIHLAEKHDIYEFSCADSILNGNMPALKDCVSVLADYNKDRPDNKKIKFGGSWIARPPGRLSPEFFKLLRQGGGHHFTIGAEHGSNEVLKQMDKRTNVEGLWYEVDQMHQNGIQCVLNNIIGHWSETAEDWWKHIDQFLNMGPFIANRTITQITISFFAVFSDTPVVWNKKENGVETLGDNSSINWYTRKNPNLTMKTRLARLWLMFRIAMGMKYPIQSPFQFLLMARNRVAETWQEGLKFLEKHIDRENYETCESVKYLNDLKKFDEAVAKRIERLFPNTELVLKVSSTDCKGSPGLYVTHNGEELYRKILPEGQHTIRVPLKNNFKDITSLKIGLFNKKPTDTQVDAEGNVIKDKKITVDNFILDKIDIMLDQEFYFKHTKYTEKGRTINLSHAGFYHADSSLELEWFGAFWKHFLLKRFDNELHWQVNNDPKLYLPVLEQIKHLSEEYEY